MTRAVEPPLATLGLWGTVLRGKWLLMFSIAISLGLNYYRFTIEPPIYGSSARVLVNRPEAQLPVAGVETNEFRDELETQIALLKSPRIIEPAIREGELDKLPSLAGRSNLVRLISANLKIRHETRGILDLSFSWFEPQDCRTVLRAVVTAYGEYLEQSHRELNTEAVRLISEAKDDLQQQLAASERDYRKFRAETPNIWKADGKESLLRSRLTGIEERRSNSFLEKTELVAEKRSIEAALKSGGNREALMLMIDKLTEQRTDSGRATPAQSLTAPLFPLMLEEQMLLERVGPMHPSVRKVRRQIEITRRLLRSDPGTAKGQKPEKEQDFVTVYIASLDQRVKLLNSQEEAFTSMLADEREKLKLSSDVELKDQSIRDQIDRTKRLFELVVQRLGEIKLNETAGAYTMEVINKSSRAQQTAPDLARFMTTGTIFGLLVGLALTYIREKVDNRFLAPEDIHAQLGVPVIGHVADMPRSIRNAEYAESPIDPTVVAFHKPQSQHAECYRAVRIALYFNTQASGHRVIQVTSPSPGDGKSTLASNLAVSIANSHKSVLLVDADLRRPRVHKIFGLDNRQGFVQVLRGQAELADVLQSSTIDGLDCMVCGRRPSDPAELLTSSSFERFLDVVREKYDYVILDTPPLLAVTDPSVVAARVDAVFLTIRLQKNSRNSATRAAEILGSIGATLAGVVVNGAGAKKSYGYGKYGRYGSYRYTTSGYVYGYGGGLGYSYDSDYADYATDDLPVSEPAAEPARVESAEVIQDTDPASA
jgi:capsular exopolysaccharide synthesis family protein